MVVEAVVVLVAVVVGRSRSRGEEARAAIEAVVAVGPGSRSGVG